MKTTPLKDLRIIAGRAEAQITALKLTIASFDGKTDLMEQRVDTLTHIMSQLRSSIENLA